MYCYAVKIDITYQKKHTSNTINRIAGRCNYVDVSRFKEDAELQMILE